MHPWLLEEVNLAHVRDRKDPYEVAVLPMGATEPHNLHLPYGNDFLTTEKIGRLACQSAHDQGAKVVLLPTLPYGVDSNLLEFPLTIHVSLQSLEAVLRDIVRSLEHHSIHKLVLLNGHGGNDLKPLLREWYGTTSVFTSVMDWWKVGADRYGEIFTHPDDHAGEMETSVALALYPDLVDVEKMTDGAARPARFTAVRRGWVQITRPWHLLTNSSGCGDPRAATKEKGEKYLRIVTERLAEFLVELSDSTMDETFPFE